jgi:hypothetical protein
MTSSGKTSARQAKDAEVVLQGSIASHVFTATAPAQSQTAAKSKDNQSVEIS